MIYKKLNPYSIFLGSASPRRRQLLLELGIEFKIKKTQAKEYYPPSIKLLKVPEFLAKQKAEIISKELARNYLLITADTIVIFKNKIMHKPKTKEHAIKMLQVLSGKSHKVITGVCIKSMKKEITFSSVTDVTFNKLSKDEISYYIDTFNPFDKAGSYGIQEWIGFIGIKKIIGSYNNVVGLPTAKLHQKMKLFI